MDTYALVPVSMIAILMVLSLRLNWCLWRSSRRNLRRANAQLRGASIDRGLIAEQFAPFTKTFQKFGWNTQEFRFLGKPIDGVQFGENEIVIVEFKTGNAKLSAKQARIKELIERGKVRFQEIRF